MQNTATASSSLTSTRVWLITGSSSGIGRALAEATLAAGARVVVTSRSPELLDDLAANYGERVLTLPLDVTNAAQAQQVVAQAMACFGQIDVLVNNAGFGLMGAIEEVSDSEARQQFDTNVFGVLNVTRAVLPIMRCQQHGHILMVSSRSGIISTMGMGIYNASKFALEGLSEALAQELAPLGIRLTIIEPGSFRTHFLGPSARSAIQRIEDYAQTSGLMVNCLRHYSGSQQGNPALAALAMMRVVDQDQPPLRLALGPDAVEAIRSKLTTMAQELTAWETLSCSTDFSD